MEEDDSSFLIPRFLFDVEHDPFEMKNLIDDPSLRPEKSNLLNELVRLVVGINVARFKILPTSAHCRPSLGPAPAKLAPSNARLLSEPACAETRRLYRFGEPGASSAIYIWPCAASRVPCAATEECPFTRDK